MQPETLSRDFQSPTDGRDFFEAPRTNHLVSEVIEVVSRAAERAAWDGFYNRDLSVRNGIGYGISRRNAQPVHDRGRKGDAVEFVDLAFKCSQNDHLSAKIVTTLRL